MKRFLSIMAIAALTVSLTACNNETQSAPSGGVIQRPTQSTSSNSEQQQESTTSEINSENVSSSGSSTADSTETMPSDSNNEGSKILIAYFTVPETDGVDTVAGASRVVKNGEVLGITQYIAGIIQDTLGGDLFKIETVQEYPSSHSPLLDFAYNEKNNNARPELSSHIENFDEYDVVFVGYPNWNADLPMPLYTFFEEYDFGGKTIIPFVTHGGSGFSSTVRTIRDLEPNASVTENNLSVSRNNVPDAEEDVRRWAESLIAE